MRRRRLPRVRPRRLEVPAQEVPRQPAPLVHRGRTCGIPGSGEFNFVVGFLKLMQLLFQVGSVAVVRCHQHHFLSPPRVIPEAEAEIECVCGGGGKARWAMARGGGNGTVEHVNGCVEGPCLVNSDCRFENGLMLRKCENSRCGIPLQEI